MESIVRVDSCPIGSRCLFLRNAKEQRRIGRFIPRTTQTTRIAGEHLDAIVKNGIYVMRESRVITVR